MKILLTILFFVIALTGYSQTDNLPIKFKATEEADVWIGKSWDFTYTPLRNPMNVEFNGKTLKMYYDSGKTFWEINVINYERKEKKNYDELEQEAYILKIEDKGFIRYVIIVKSYTFGEIISQIKIPFVSDIGEVMSYHYYQEF